MIDVREIKTGAVDFEDIIRRSPAIGDDKALGQLKQFAKSSRHTFVGLVNGVPACVYGMMPPSLMSNRVYLWLLTTDLVEEHKFLFIRHSQIIIEQILDEFDVIAGDTVIADTRAIRWLKWLGAKYAFYNNGMAHFQITRESYANRRAA